MSIVRMDPELLATMQIGAAARVVAGGAPIGSKVLRVWVDEKPFPTVCVEIDDGIPGERMILFETVHLDVPELRPLVKLPQEPA